MHTRTIELDCPPGYPRPGDLFEEVIAGTLLPLREPVAKLFGCWTWDYGDVPEATWQDAQQVVGPRIEALHARGVIRWGSW